ncbi:hypothetical protein VHARVF571_260119 [Vibrio harveyi]|nr:hypothetical protein VHARVF571_260119 [Vibrio harveyi]
MELIVHWIAYFSIGDISYEEICAWLHNALLRCEARNTEASAYHLNH